MPGIHFFFFFGGRHALLLRTASSQPPRPSVVQSTSCDKPEPALVGMRFKLVYPLVSTRGGGVTVTVYCVFILDVVLWGWEF